MSKQGFLSFDDLVFSDRSNPPWAHLELDNGVELSVADNGVEGYAIYVYRDGGYAEFSLGERWGLTREEITLRLMQLQML
jgi:hypothetical protein